MATYKEQLDAVWEKYRKEVSHDPVDLKTVAAWAIEKGLWKPRPVDLSTSLANDLAQVLREKKRIDKVAYYDIYRYPENLPPFALGEVSFWWYDAERAEELRASGDL